MKLSEIIAQMGLAAFTKPVADVEVSCGYTSDLLSDVIAHAEKDTVWVTMQTHTNIIAVAALKDLAAIIVTGGHKPADDTLALAASKGVCVLGSELSSFDITGKLFQSGIRGECA